MSKNSFIFCAIRTFQMCVQKQDRIRRFCLYSLYYSGTGTGNGTGTGYSGFSYGLSGGLSDGRKKIVDFSSEVAYYNLS